MPPDQQFLSITTIFFQIYYFIQPKTNGQTLINDTLKQIENLTKKHGNDEQIKIVYKEGVDYESPSINEPDNNHKIVEPLEKVVPLYVPDDAFVNVFMVHSSHKSALDNVPFATGFQKQVWLTLLSNKKINVFQLENVNSETLF